MKTYILPILFIIGLLTIYGIVGSIEFESQQIAASPLTDHPGQITQTSAKLPVNLMAEGCGRVEIDDNWKETVCRFRDVNKKVTCWMILSTNGRGLSCVPDS